jgi:hypothetical protein
VTWVDAMKAKHDFRLTPIRQLQTPSARKLECA